jgi:predicted nucleotide-binding protein (sugar kinase/HSP70/actin superfamily)
MGKVVGIPRGLFYYKYYPLLKTFFEEIGAEIAVSPETNRRVMDMGVSACVGEACLPVKAYFGHALDLKDKADAIFIPRYTSVYKNEYICPKFGGLPDMARAGMKSLPEVITPEVNMHDRKDGGLRAAVEAGRALGAGRKASKHAYEKAVNVYLEHRAGLMGTTIDGRTQYPDAWASSGCRPRPAAPTVTPAENSRGVLNTPDRLRILLLGHCYTVGDRFINMDAARKLSTLGADAVTLDTFDGRVLRSAAGSLEKPLFWSFGTQALGCAYLLMQDASVDGVLHLTCFGCGVDSFVGYMFERRVRRAGIPFATISLDEHTGEAGLQTRLEAFTDTLRTRRAGA